MGRLAAYDCRSERTILGRLLFSIDGDQLAGGPVERFAESVMDIGHVDGDAAVHWAIGAPGAGTESSPPSAIVILHERGGQLVERLRLEGPSEARLGWRLAPLEIADGTSFYASFAAGAPGQRRGSRPAAGAVHRFNSRTGARLWTRSGSKRGQHLGYALESVPDRNADGFPDLIAGAPGRGNDRTRGRVLLLSGVDGRVLEEVVGPPGATLFGFAVTIAHVDTDGVFDLLVGAPAADSDGLRDNGAVFAYSGADGSLLRRWNGLADGEWLGVSVAGVIDRDGGPLLAVAAASLLRDAAAPKRDLRGALTFFAPDSADILGRRLGKRAGDRLGWPILTCIEGCLVGQPRSPELFTPD